MLPNFEETLRKINGPEEVEVKQAGPLAAVQAGLAAAGFGPLEILALTRTVISLLREYGPQIAEIVETLRKLFKPEPNVIG